MNAPGGAASGVGPVLQSTPFARLIVDTICEENEGVVVRDEGAYLRVLVPRVCRLSVSALEAASGTEVRFPGDLEVLMSSFSGRMRLDEHGAVWWLGDEPDPAAADAGRADGDR